MFVFFRKYPSLYRIVASYLLVHFVSITIIPTVSYAITSGPSQPETQAFKPMGASDMVDLFSGDFSYNIPLFELPGPNGGYPFNLSYHGNPSMDEEASWVGLGWNLNVGAINRSVRGLPDEFDGNKGDAVYKYTNMRMSKNYELTLQPNALDLTFGSVFSTGVSTKYSISYNNSFGYNIGFNADVNALKIAAAFGNSRITAGYSLGLGVNTGYGATVSKGLTISGSGKSQDAKHKTILNSYLLGGSLGYTEQISSRNGLLSQSLNMNLGDTYKKTEFGVGANYSLYRAGVSYPPSVDSEMNGKSFSFDLKVGKAYSANLGFLLMGLSDNASANLTVNFESLRDNGATVPYKPFGYLSLQEFNPEGDTEIMIDVNREKDRAIRKSNKYLGTSNLMPDNFTLSGQGIGGSFRAFRRDIGFSHDNNSASVSSAANTGMTLSPGAAVTEFGTSTGVNYNRSTSKKWAATDDNRLDGGNKFRFRKSNVLKSKQTASTNRTLDENIYFKLYGESTIKNPKELENIGGSNAWKPKITGNDNLENLIDKGNGLTPTTPNEVTAEALVAALPKNREERNTYIQAITNEMILKAQVTNTNSQALREYNVSYFVDGNSTAQQLQRANTAKYPAHHIGGFTAQNTDGTRYIYALPVYNNYETEHNYSVKPLDRAKQAKIAPDKSDQGTVNNTEEAYKSEQKTSRYPYAYMLTSVLGADYVDADNIPGPSAGDVGYWVKFEYQKLTDDYLWRAPFVGANYIKGQYNVLRDDKAAFTIGSKEIYYLYTAETSSHKAFFNTSERLDAYGVNDIDGDYDAANAAYLGKSQRKLETVKLYSKMELKANDEQEIIPTTTKPITTVNLKHSYELCKGVANNKNTVKKINYAESGKLTLTKLTFSYENNSRGTLSPYEFHYTSTQDTEDIKKENPDYDTHSLDRWGTYKKTNKTTAAGEEDLNNYFDFPYTIQDKDYPRELYAGVWSMKEIKLPSGASIEVNYESDDYAYVQDKKAMQMYEITGIDQAVGFNYSCKSAAPKIFFKLPEEAQTLSGGDLDEYLQSFLDNAPVYVKAMVRLKSEESSYELISGYLDVDARKMGIVTQNGKTYAYVQFKANQGYHPLSVAAWQHMQTAQPHIIYQYQGENPTDDTGVFDVAKGMINALGDLLQELSQGYYSLAASRNWGTKISKGWIRLNNINGKKYGGGARVKRVLIKDNWRIQAGEDAVYGQVYDYTIPNPANPTQRISSGVAAFEPGIGGEENALKYGIKEHIDIISGNSTSHYFDAPINESHYPGPSVGYQQVSVKSLAASALAKETVMNDLAKYFGSRGQFAASGEVVHEFYTAKDFPVFTNESPIQIMEPSDNALSIALSSFYSSKTTMAGQGFAIEINDMHGKPKAVSYYAQNTTGEVQRLTPVSWVRYHYQTATKTINNKKFLVLENTVPVLISDDQLTNPKGKPPVIDNYLMGVDYDLFADARQYTNYAWSVSTPVKFGVGTNGTISLASFSLLPPPLTTRNDGIKMITFNKVIHRSGILKKTEAFDGGAIVSTENHYWGQNGEVLVSSVANNFEDRIYTYNIPAYFVYDLTGFAAKGQGLEPTIKVTYNSATNRYVLNTAANDLGSFKHLFALGDEWHIHGKRDMAADLASPTSPLIIGSPAQVLPTQKWTVAAITSQGLEFEFTGTHNQSLCNAGLDLCNTGLATLLYRSGRRNQLSAKVGHITALINKAETPERIKEILFTKRASATCTITIEKPKCIN